jgi:hypothetical protein
VPPHRWSGSGEAEPDSEAEVDHDKGVREHTGDEPGVRRRRTDPDDGADTADALEAVGDAAFARGTLTGIFDR